MTTTNLPPLTVADIIKLCGGKATKAGNGVLVRCPAHNDEKASLSVSNAASGKILLNCYAGCNYKTILAKLELDPQQLFPASTQRNGREIVATYDYTDADGKRLFQVARTPEKSFPAWHPDAKGEKIWNLQGVERVPYRLPELIQGIAEERVVYIVEGEKDADNLREIGFTATTNPHGAGKWRDEYNQHFAGANVVVIPDNDPQGQQHAEDVRKALTGIAASVRILELPNLPPKGDVSDWLHSGGTAAQLKVLVLSPIQTSPSSRDDRRRESPRSLGEWLKNPALLVPIAALIEWIAFLGRCSLLAAREKTGKSTLLAQAVAALTTGGMFLGHHLDRAVVLWYCLDEMIADCVQRFLEMGGDPDYLIISIERPTAAEMKEEAEECGAQVVVVDTLTELWRGQIRSEKDADEVSVFLDPYIRAMRELNRALVFSHHTPKSGYDYRGSGAIGAKVDVLLLLRRPGTGMRAEDVNETEEDPETDDGRRILEGRGRGVPHFVHRLSFADRRYSLGEAPLPLRDRIVSFLKQGGASTRSIREHVRGKSQRVTDTMTQTQADKVVYRAGSLWQLSEGGSHVGENESREPPPKPPSGPHFSAGTAREPGGNHSGTSRAPEEGGAVPSLFAREKAGEPAP